MAGPLEYNRQGTTHIPMHPGHQDLDREKFGDLTYCTTQILTGRGDFGTYLKFIKKRTRATCVVCTTGEDDDVNHTVFIHIPALKQTRGDLAEDGTNSIAQLVTKMLSTEEQ